MNVAILIGVSEYAQKENNLPGCANDVKAFSEILKASNKYEHFLLLENHASAIAKEKLITFIEGVKGQEIDEILFYYSGHGEYYGNEYYYLLSDFDEKKRQSSSLQNNFLDDLIRNLSPTLAVKIIDACQSGTSYIKSPDILKKYFDATQKGFNKCYFLYSSLNSQLSYQDGGLSFFTKSLIEAVKNCKTEEIRYKHLLDYISDQFLDNNEQTPFFVVQAEYTEKFCKLSPEFRKHLAGVDDEFSKEEKDSETAEGKSLFDIIKSDAKKYISKERADQILEELKNKFLSDRTKGKANELFNEERSLISDLSGITQIDPIGYWLKNNPNEFCLEPISEPDFLVSPTVRGIRYTIELPYCGFRVSLNAKYQNTNSYAFIIIYAISKKEIIFFMKQLSYLWVGWSDKKPIQNNDWLYAIEELNNVEHIYRAIVNMINTSLKTVFDELEKKFLPQGGTGPSAPINTDEKKEKEH